MKPNESNENPARMSNYIQLASAAAEMHDIYLAFKEAGFSEREAMEIVMGLLKEALKK